jgi:catechol 2,3-dioxygenase-like lactoylglutathione lyase family enzyme
MLSSSSAQTADEATRDERPPVWSGHISAGARDTAESARFYEAIGLRPVFVSDEFAVLELRGGTHILLRLDADLVAGPVSFVFMVEDLGVTHAEWAVAGLAVSAISHRGVHDSFTVTDPAGNVIRVSDSHVVGVV